jgi:hypothetical protein
VTWRIVGRLKKNIRRQSIVFGRESVSKKENDNFRVKEDDL